MNLNDFLKEDNAEKMGEYFLKKYADSSTPRLVLCLSGVARSILFLI